MSVQKMYKQGHGTFDADNVNVTWVGNPLKEVLHVLKRPNMLQEVERRLPFSVSIFLRIR